MKTIGDHELIELKNVDQLPHPASQREKLMQEIMGSGLGCKESLADAEVSLKI